MLPCLWLDRLYFVFADKTKRSEKGLIPVPAAPHGEDSGLMEVCSELRRKVNENRWQV